MDKQDLEEMWVGMPEYVQEDKAAFKRVVINFENEDDMNEFNKITGLKITKKTKGVFFPVKKNKKIKYIKE